MINKIKELLSEKDFILIAIDGRCGAGKTTLAEKLKKDLSANVIQMDDFFLRPEQRTEKRLLIPGENIDHERFSKEVLIPLSENKIFSFRPFNCKTQTFSEPVYITPSKITVIEGSYSCHPRLWDFYDLHIFVDTDYTTQLERIKKRNGEEKAEIFKNKWIPLEESYFKEFNIKERCEIKIES